MCVNACEQRDSASRAEERSAALATATAQLAACEADRARLESSIGEKEAEISLLLARVHEAELAAKGFETQLTASEARVAALKVRRFLNDLIRFWYCVFVFFIFKFVFQETDASLTAQLGLVSSSVVDGLVRSQHEVQSTLASFGDMISSQLVRCACGCFV